jgi:hypothetical protein
VRASRSPTPSVCYSSLTICSPPTHVVKERLVLQHHTCTDLTAAVQLNNVSMYLHGRSPSVSSVQCSGSEHPLLSVPSQVRYAKCFLLQQALSPSVLDVVLALCCHLGALQSGAQRGVIGK